MSNLEIVSMVKINGVWHKQEDIPPEEFRRLLEEKIDTVMQNIGFRRKETA